MAARNTTKALPLDPDETEGLLLSHITTWKELNYWEQLNISRAEEWAFSRRHTDLLSREFICLLHKKMFGSVWAGAGQFRRTLKNIGACPEQIAAEIDRLCLDAHSWLEYAMYPPDEICLRFHHKLVWKRPFESGNGRLGRLMADLMAVQLFSNEPFTWGGAGPYQIQNSRSVYIAALQAAHDHDYSQLLKFARS